MTILTSQAHLTDKFDFQDNAGGLRLPPGNGGAIANFLPVFLSDNDRGNLGVGAGPTRRFLPVGEKVGVGPAPAPHFFPTGGNLGVGLAPAPRFPPVGVKVGVGPAPTPTFFPRRGDLTNSASRTMPAGLPSGQRRSQHDFLFSPAFLNDNFDLPGTFN